MRISLHPKKCCKVPALSNTTTIDDFGCAGFTNPGIAPHTHDDVDCVCGGGAVVAAGPWPARGVPQVFTAGDPVVMNTCNGIGQKLAVAKKCWQGRNGFVQDYINDPKGAGPHFRSYAVAVTYSMSFSGWMQASESDTGQFVFGGANDYSGSQSGHAQSTRYLNDGGIEICSGSATASDGTASESPTGLCAGGTDNPNCYEFFSCVSNPWPGLMGKTDGCYTTDQAPDRASNIGLMKSYCGIDGDRGWLTIAIPLRGLYSGPASGFGEWLTRENRDYNTPFDGPSNGFPEGTGGASQDSFVYEITNFSVTNNSISGGVKLKMRNAVQDVNLVGSTWYEHWFKTEMDFSFNVSLGSEYTFADAYAAATGLLNNFDFTDNKAFPWTMPADCRIAPMISLYELNSVPGSGYCEAPAAGSQAAIDLANQMAIYDGSVKGALINYYPATGTKYATGIYSPGWFDWAFDINTYSTGLNGTCGSRLCYSFGAYPGAACGVTMATQITTGSLDSSDCLGFTPFSRYLNTWIGPMRPPYVDVSCGFAGDGGDGIYVSKYAEKKVPLPSQNFFGACGAMRTQTLIDTSCTPFDPPQLRYPGAWSICGKAAIASIAFTDTYMVGGILNGTVRVTLTDPADTLITTDAVDFLDASNAVTTANIAVTVVDSTHFNFPYTVAPPTGVAIKSHGAPDPAWYNLNPKGDFIWGFNTGNAWDGTSVSTILQDNLAFTGGILFVGPAGSPEIGNPKWPSKTTRIQSGYPGLAPGGHWYCNPQQAMTDRYLTYPQDGLESDGGTPPLCNRKIPPFDYPLVEAMSVAPHNAPYTFAGADGIATQPLLTPDGLGFRCSGIWNATDKFSGLGYSTWPGTQHGSGALTSQNVTGNKTSDNITGLGPA